MQLMKFFKEHQKLFPTLWILVQKKASCRVVDEVGCERFLDFQAMSLLLGVHGLGYVIMNVLQCYKTLNKTYT